MATWEDYRTEVYLDSQEKTEEILAKGFSKVFAYDTIRKILYLDAYFYNVSEIKTELKPYETTADGWKFF